jgi:hypothetical protein
MQEVKAWLLHDFAGKPVFELDRVPA